jgi:hypothetical protein
MSSIAARGGSGTPTPPCGTDHRHVLRPSDPRGAVAQPAPAYSTAPVPEPGDGT